MRNKNNQNKNNNCKPQKYIVREKVKDEDPYKGPYPIIQVLSNGNVAIRQEAIQDRINISYVNPYHK